MLGALTSIARIAVLATVIVSLAAIVMDFGLHVEGTDWLEGALLTIV